MKKNWFVIQTLSGQENKVKENIERRKKIEEMDEYVGDVLVPMETVVEVREGKKKVTRRKLYPGYVFIDVALLDENQQIVDASWYFVRDTPGIIGFVGGHRPAPASEEEIATVRAQISDSEDRERPKIKFEEGESVRISDGPFRGSTGVISKIDAERGKICVMVNIFGRSTQVEQEYWCVEKA